MSRIRNFDAGFIDDNIRISRRTFAALPLAPLALKSSPVPALEEPHFPSRLHCFVWRNWELANLDRMAAVVGTQPDRLAEVGRSLGLPAKPKLTPDQLRRLYITVIRQNWHLLPSPQIIELLGWTPERFAFTLKEDDFLDVKLGFAKPECEPLLYRAPTAAEQEKAAKLRGVIERTFGAALHEPGEALFQFVDELTSPRTRLLRRPSAPLGDHEVDLSELWALSIPQDPEPIADVAFRFSRWMETAMGARFRGLPSQAHLIRPRINSGLGLTAGSYELTVSEAGVWIEGADLEAIVRCFHDLRAEMTRRGAPFLAKGRRRSTAVWNPRYLYSYSALYGDPLTEPETDPFPDGYLDRLAACGINGVWMQAVLNTLAPSKTFPEFGRGWETRLRNLRSMVERARRFGIKVFLYLNEPRSMPPSFFEKRPHMRGATSHGLNAMCTSVPEVRDWIAGSLEHIVRHVPAIGGFFSISMSENQTNCFSHGGGWGKKVPNARDCPRCNARTSWDTLGELLTTFRDGVRRASPIPDVIAWDWGWPSDMADRLIPLLPRDMKFMSISEWEQPVARGGVNTRVGEYSISVTGPGPRARHSWATAKANGIATMAKVQFNNTWEISAVPYIPVPPLVLRHARNLSSEGIRGVMASWTCGGYPSPNLAAISRYAFEPRPPDEQILLDVAAERYGPDAAPVVVDAWHRLSRAFEEFPYGVAIYVIPTQHGPANPLRLRPTGRKASMILFPHDDLKSWCGAYPPEAVEAQFTRLSDGWRAGADRFREAVPRVPPGNRPALDADLAIIETCYHHFRSTANQVAFYRLRGQLPTGDRRDLYRRMKSLAEEEIRLARAQFVHARRNSTIAYEASNHYYYTPLDLVEKVLNCTLVIQELENELAG